MLDLLFARILALANLSDGTDNDRLEFLSLRKYTPKERIEIIECALATTEGIGLVIIDGVRDLLFDINAPLEATQITSILMRWTDEYQIHIHTILHQNKVQLIITTPCIFCSIADTVKNVK